MVEYDSTLTLRPLLRASEPPTPPAAIPPSLELTERQLLCLTACTWFGGGGSGNYSSVKRIGSLEVPLDVEQAEDRNMKRLQPTIPAVWKR